jgi:hypothetical protein
MRPTKEQIIEAVREKAKRNYNREGWDILVECWEDDDILDAVGFNLTEGCESIEDAIEACNERLRVSNDMRRDIEAERF